MTGFFGENRYRSDAFIDNRFNAGFVQFKVISAFAKGNVTGNIDRNFIGIYLAFRKGRIQQSHPAIDVVADGGGHDRTVQAQHSADGHAEADVDIGGGEDFPGRGQAGGIVKLMDRLRLKINSLRGENRSVRHHLAVSFDTQSIRIDAYGFYGLFRHFFSLFLCSDIFFDFVSILSA